MQSDLERVRRPGRRKDAGKRDAILTAARSLMFASGVEAVTMEQVAAMAGVSKVTVYAHFRDKLALFEAVVRRQAEWLTAPLDEPTLAARLAAFGLRLLRFLTAPERLAADRVLRHEARRHPELAGRFFAAGPGRVREQLAAMLAAAAADNQLCIRDPRQAAEDLIALWRGFLDLEAHFQAAATPDDEQLRQRARRSVDVFLRAYRRPGAGPVIAERKNRLAART